MKLELQQLVVEKAAMPDLKKLKELSDRLHLSPKRESVIQWHTNLEELQSEGIYPATSRIGNKRKSPLVNEEETTGENKQNNPDNGCGANDSHDNEESIEIEPEKEEKEETEDKYFDTLSTVKLRNLKKNLEHGPSIRIKSKNRLSAQRSVSLRSETAPQNRKQNQHQAAKFFRQRTPAECQEKIRKYALRLDESGSSIECATEEQKIRTSERYHRIGQALERIRTDLLDMRIQDNTLARQLLDGRKELNQVKAEKTWDEHANMLDDFSWELEIEEELTEQLRSFDLPSAFLRKPDSLLRSSSPLRLIGLSRMTMDSRRFSVI